MEVAIFRLYPPYLCHPPSSEASDKTNNYRHGIRERDLVLHHLVVSCYGEVATHSYREAAYIVL